MREWKKDWRKSAKFSTENVSFPLFQDLNAFKQNEMNGLPLKSEDQVTKHKLEPDRRKILSRKFGRVAQIYSIFQPTEKALLANNQSRCSISKTNLLHCAKNFFRSVLVI